MLSRRSFFRKLLDNPRARELFMNSLAVGEADSAVGLDRVAEHIADPIVARKVYRHYAEEVKHARLFGQHLEKTLGVSPKPLPPELDYEQYVRRYEMGTPASRLDDPTPFSDDELITFFVGCKAGEERAMAEMGDLVRDLGADPETVEVLEIIHGDEIRHVSYATEELNRLADAGNRERVVQELRRARRAEARAHRHVSRAFLGRLMEILEVPRAIRFFAGLSIDVQCVLRILSPGGLDRPLVENPMPVPEGPRGQGDPAESA